MNTKILLVVAAHALTCLALPAQNLLLNASFESPALPPDSSSPTTPELWQAAESPPSLENRAALPGYPSPQDGQQWIGLGVEPNGSHNGVSQTFNLTTAGTYALTWFHTTPLGYGTNAPYSVSVRAGAQPIFSANLDAYHDSLAWVSNSTTLALSAGPHTLVLRAEDPIGHVGAAVDNVSLVLIEPDMLTTIRCSQAEICWNSLANRPYKVQYRSELTTNEWTDLFPTNFIATDSETCVFDDIPRGRPQRYYRVVPAP